MQLFLAESCSYKFCEILLIDLIDGTLWYIRDRMALLKLHECHVNGAWRATDL